MTKKEAELILIESLLHTKETRIDYFISKAKEMEVSLLPYVKTLLNAYDRLHKMVNTYDYTVWGVDEETGKKVFAKQPINLFHYTGNKYVGTLTDENIIEIAEPLYLLANQIIEEYNNTKQEKNTKSVVSINELTLYEFLDIITDTNNSNDLIFTSIEIFNYLNHESTPKSDLIYKILNIK